MPDYDSRWEEGRDPDPVKVTCVHVLEDLVEQIQGEIRQLAETGDVLACDELHSQIADLESAISIVKAESDTGPSRDERPWCDA